MPPAFSRAARSMEFLPEIIDYLGRAGHLDNRIYMVMLILVWVIIAVRCREFLKATEWSFFATYMLSPMLHAWYLVSMLPFAVKSKNAGTIALAATGTLYYIVHYNMEQHGGSWTLLATRCHLAAFRLWLPLVPKRFHKVAAVKISGDSHHRRVCYPISRAA
jgi:hypothetical protein